MVAITGTVLLIFEAALGSQCCVIVVPVWQMRLRLREAKTLALSQTEAEETRPQPWLSGAAVTLSPSDLCCEK